jgi:hypothetical protein
VVGPGVVGHLDSGLLANLGNLEFSTIVRHRRDTDMCWNLDGQFSSNLKPGSFIAGDRFGLDARCERETAQRSTFHWGNGIPFRVAVSAMGAADFSVPYSNTISIDLGIAKGSLRPARIVAPMRGCLVCILRRAFYQSGEKHELRLCRSLFPSFMGTGSNSCFDKHSVHAGHRVFTN